ncbi:MAG: hypothetical protein AAAB16_22100, partial [Pseudomonas sp.]|uniref:hypothetical protein n=1 Tax=Pseudomonas sp. TaxID=306 RepID=UPI0030F1C9C4
CFSCAAVNPRFSRGRAECMPAARTVHLRGFGKAKEPFYAVAGAAVADRLLLQQQCSWVDANGIYKYELRLFLSMTPSCMIAASALRLPGMPYVFAYTS